WTLPRIRELQAYCARMGYRGPVMNQALFNAASDRMNPPGDDTMAVMDPEMQAWHREIAGTPRDVLAAGYMGNCGGFFQQYLSGGDRNVREKAFLTDGNRKAAAEIAAAAEKKGRTVTQEVLDFYTTVPFPCMALFAPRDTAGLAEVMEVFR
ncbi:MAG: aldo/keto reductase, partial [Clostridia bacterium]|nr:aldo/keto reductase [Clostridia bacterium]